METVQIQTQDLAQSLNRDAALSLDTLFRTALQKAKNQPLFLIGVFTFGFHRVQESIQFIHHAPPVKERKYEGKRQ